MDAVNLHAQDRSVLFRSIRRTRRAGIRVDTTPLVDVAFLLLTFFMCATTMTEPQLLELSMPAGIPVGQAEPLTLLLCADGRLFARVGTHGILQRTTPADVPSLLAPVRTNDRSDGRCLIHVAPYAHYGRMIALIDVLRAAGVEDLSMIRTMTTDEQKEVATL